MFNRRYVGRHVVVEVQGRTIRGTVQRSDRVSVTVERAQLVDAGQTVPVDGVLVVPWVSVTWMQVV